MECPKCGNRAYVTKKYEYRHKAGEPLEEIRVYVCENMTCLHSFAYRNTYLEPRERTDAERFLKRIKAKEKTNQEELFNEE